MSGVTASSVSVTLRQGRVLLPGARSPLEAPLLVYRAVLLPLTLTNESRPNTPCGLDLLASTLQGARTLTLTMPPDQTGGNLT